MASTVIGRLFADFVSRTDRFTPGAKRVDRHLIGIRKSLKQTQLGTRALSGAFVGLAGSVVGLNLGKKLLGVSGDFEASMKRVAAISGATETDLAKLDARAQSLGRTTQFKASEAADTIEVLLKNGLSVQQVMEGALDSSLTLAAATGAELAAAGDIATDVMLGFKKEASDLSKIVDGITGTTLNSKFGIEDYAAALGSAGGAVGAVGVEVEDFNAVLAATSNSFKTGEEAGTSFKTFVTRLAPESGAAARAMKQLGLEFFDAEGNLKSMADVTGQLETAFGTLTEKQRIQAAQTIFGRNSMRTALTLAATGRERFEELAAAIEKVDAQEQARKRLEGWNGMLLKLNSAIEGVILRLGFEGGLLGAATAVGEKLTEWIGVLANLNPEFLKWTAGIVASIAGFTAFSAAVSAVTAVLTAFAVPAALLVAKVALITAAFAAAIAAGAALGIALKTIADVSLPVVSRGFDLLAATVSTTLNGLAVAALSAASLIVRGFEYQVAAAADGLNALIRAFNRLPEFMRGGLEVGEIDVSSLMGGADKLDALSARFKEKAVEAAGSLNRLLAEPLGGPDSFSEQYVKNFNDTIGELEAMAKLGGEKLNKWLFKQPAKDTDGESSATDTVADEVGAIASKFKEVDESVEAATKAMNKFGEETADTLTEGIARGEKLTDVLGDIAAKMRGAAIRSLLQGAEDEDGKRHGGLLGAAGKVFAKVGALGGLGKVFGGFFAGGGVLGAGKWGIAGEHGPEPIVGPARVIPNHAMNTGGGMNVNITQNFNVSGGAGGMSAQDIAEAARQATMETWAEIRRRPGWA